MRNLNLGTTIRPSADDAGIGFLFSIGYQRHLVFASEASQTEVQKERDDNNLVQSRFGIGIGVPSVDTPRWVVRSRSINILRSVILLIGLVAAQNRICGQDTNWFTLTSTAGGFSIKFPTKPQEMSFNRETVKGVIHYNMWTLERPDRAFNITFIDIPDITPSEGEKLVDSSLVSQIHERFGGKLLKEADTRVGTHPGKEFTIELDDGAGLYRGKAFMVGVRQFTLLVVGETKRKDEDDLTFLNSFLLATNLPTIRPTDSGTNRAQQGAK